MTVSLAAFYTAIMAKAGYMLPGHLRHVIAALEDERIQKLMICLGPSSGKSSLIDTIYPIWQIGKDPSTSILGVSAGEALIQRYMKAGIDIVENSPYYSACFPKVKPNKALGWSPERGYFVNGKSPGDPNPSFIAFGLASQFLTGAHAKVVIMDDIHDSNSESSRDACEKVVGSWYNTLLHRDVASGTRFVLIGRRWSIFDIYGHLRDTGNWVVMTLPVDRGDGTSELWWDILVPEGLECCFTEGMAAKQEQTIELTTKKLVSYKAYYGVDPEKKGFYWPDYPYIRQRCAEAKIGSPDSYQSVFQCNPGARVGSVFLEKDFRYFTTGGKEILSADSLPDFLKRGTIIQSWDTSQKKNEQADYSVCMTGVAIPCAQWHREETESLVGEADPHYDVYIVNVLRKKMEIQELLQAVRAMHRIWIPSQVLMEDRASGIEALSALKNAGIPLIGVKTDNKSKRARAVEGIGGTPWSVQGWMQQGRILFWAEMPGLDILKAELKDFVGDGSGIDDQTDSLSYLVAHVINLGTGSPRLPADLTVDNLTKPSLSELALVDPRAIPLANIEIILAQREIIDEPQFCATCRMHQHNICQIYNRRTAGLDSCLSWQSKKAPPESGAWGRRL